MLHWILTILLWASFAPISQASGIGTGSAPASAELDTAGLFTQLTQERMQDGTAETVIISIPAQLHESNFPPFGDGQTNARIDFGPHWQESLPPLIAVRTTFTDGRPNRDEFLFHPSLNVIDFELTTVDELVLVKPAGWTNSFRISFTTQAYTYSEFAKGLPSNFEFSMDRRLPDPEGVSTTAAKEGLTPLEAMLKKPWSSDYNQEPYLLDNVHGRFPDREGDLTALGGGWSWVSEDLSQVPFKHVYSCFAAQDENLENQLGVPTGSGWHKIGDPAETLLNTLEDASLLVALGRKPKIDDSANLAFGLEGVVTATYLKPGSVLVTLKNQFHWYRIEASRPLCTEIWVHPCEPNPGNLWGFSCSN